MDCYVFFIFATLLVVVCMISWVCGIHNLRLISWMCNLRNEMWFWWFNAVEFATFFLEFFNSIFYTPYDELMVLELIGFRGIYSVMSCERCGQSWRTEGFLILANLGGSISDKLTSMNVIKSCNNVHEGMMFCCWMEKTKKMWS